MQPPVHHTAGELSRALAPWRAAGERIALVPTMGNLHAGHLDLVDRARTLADRVAVSIFVNPTQFGPGEDYDSYPRTPDADRTALAEHGADLVFAPAVETLYPGGLPPVCRVEVPGLSEMLCGASRPGHFTGVATVVTKLLNLVRPDLAVFGEKDFQQLVIIRALVRELFLDVDIEGVATRREADGLAMSSRNGYLDADQRERAVELYRTLTATAEALERGGADLEELVSEGRRRLEAAGFAVDYVAIRRASDLAAPRPGDTELVVLGAGYMGPARLIDNVRARVPGGYRDAP